MNLGAQMGSVSITKLSPNWACQMGPIHCPKFLLTGIALEVETHTTMHQVCSLQSIRMELIPLNLKTERLFCSSQVINLFQFDLHPPIITPFTVTLISIREKPLT